MMFLNLAGGHRINIFLSIMANIKVKIKTTNYRVKATKSEDLSIPEQAAGSVR